MRQITFITVLFLAFFTSCNNKSERMIEKLQEERDSILEIKTNQDKILDDLTATLFEVSVSLDSVSAEEKTIKRQIEDGSYTSKKELLDNLRLFKERVSNYRQRLEKMEKQLASRADQLEKMSQMIKFLNQELSQKEETINRLQQQLEKKNVDIAHLKNEVKALGSSVSDLEKENKTQAKEIETLNEVYYIIGSSKELKNKGILTGGFFKKKKVDYSSLDLNQFVKADRKLQIINIPSKSAKVLSNAPSNSYTIETTSENSCVLNILNKDKFWSASSILVIQTK